MSAPRQPILELPAAEVAKICAGEVVERPLSVVKELVENALDAGATRVAVELEDGGKELIRVTDDGGGIPFAELPLALKRHCTSKIRSLDDLFRVTSLGFRGEALGSIAAVSRLSLTSRVAGEELGGRIVCAGGELQAPLRLAFQQGTEVEVRELFFNTPARKKFLRSRQAETSQIAALMATYALARPEVRFSLSAGGRVIIESDGAGGTRSVFAGLADPELAAALLELDYEHPPLAVRGLVSPPSHHRHNRTRQWFFVNGRPVTNKLFFRALDDAMLEHLSPGKHPSGVFFIELPPEEVDVNIHPMKAEVSFAQPQLIYSLLVTAVRRALGRASQARREGVTRGLSVAVRPAPLAPGPGLEQPLIEREAPSGQRAVPVFDMGKPFEALGAAPPPEAPARPGAEPARAGAAVRPAGQEAGPPAPEEAPALDAALLEYLLRPASAGGGVQQVAGTYLIACTPEEVLIIDQHAAHERVLFEELTAPRPGEAARQRLLFPLVVGLSPAEGELAEELLPALSGLGFRAAVGAGPSLVVSEVPLPLRRQADQALLQAVFAELATQGRSRKLDVLGKELAASLACKAAIKAGDPLPLSERIELLRRVLALEGLSCPHGRPVLLRLGRGELERMFLR